ncbi:unnamed protein product [Psylliodes chrysocephalus]|uniref:BED-type domain-containing protein n=1 Tax=Psylliodes chrysocephalus TaxID=3402493 RepID=A0A9P0GB94_9CUCU|nr:unnamed protein product [Psylliodes chrysocephala]
MMETDEVTTPEGNNDGFTLVERKKRKKPGNESDSESEDTQNRKITDTKVVPEENSGKTKATSKPKPPPIILARAGRWFQLRLGLRDREIRYLSTVYRNGELKIWPETEEDYRRMQKYFIEMEEKFHCFTLKEDKPYKAVIRGIPEDTDLKVNNEKDSINKPKDLTIINNNNNTTKETNKDKTNIDIQTRDHRIKSNIPISVNKTNEDKNANDSKTNDKNTQISNATGPSGMQQTDILARPSGDNNTEMDIDSDNESSSSSDEEGFRSDEVFAKFNVCLTKLSYKTSISNLRRHLQSKHPTVTVPIPKMKSSVNTGTRNINNTETYTNPQSNEITDVHAGPSSSTNKENNINLKRKTNNSGQLQISSFVSRPLVLNCKEYIDGKLILLFTKSFQPFRLVEETAFKDFVNPLNPNYELPSRHMISHTMKPVMYDKCKIRVRDLIKEARKVCICIPTDSWTSHNNDRYTAVTAHYIDDHHTSENLAKELHRIVGLGSSG